MSKLDGNNRWSSKFLLPEYVQIYNARDKNEPVKPITEQEMEVACEYILLTHLLTMIDNAISDIEYAPVYVRSLVRANLSKLHQTIYKDKQVLGLKLKRSCIKVVPAEQNDDLAIYFRIYCRGYQEKFPITREYARAEMQVRLTRYNNLLIDHLKKFQKG